MAESEGRKTASEPGEWVTILLAVVDGDSIVRQFLKGLSMSHIGVTMM